MKLFIVDNQVLFREGLVYALQNQPDIEVVGEAGSLRETLERVPQILPDLVLLDLVLPDGSGIDAMTALLGRFPGIKFIFLTSYESDNTLIDAFRSGAKGYVLKSTPIEKLLVTLRVVERGEIGLSRSMASRVIQEFSRMAGLINHFQNGLNNLTYRELEVLKEIGTGASNRAIATRLFITESTVKIHVHNIYEKLKLQNRHQAVNFARNIGFVKTELEPTPMESE